MNGMGAPGSDDVVRNRFLRAALDDLEAGALRPLEDYQRELAQGPAQAELVAAEYRLLERGEVDDPTPGFGVERVGPYRVLGELGRGGQGVVLECEDERLGRRVAVKLLVGLAGLHPGSVGRLRREAALAARLRHPGLCTVYEAGVADGVPYVAMELVEGESLAVRIRGARSGELAPPDPLEAARIVAAAARALHAAHQGGVVHRDVKPGNLVLRPDGSPVVLDFGLARDLEGEGDLTRTGDVLGTPAYMAPEQLEGAPSQGARVDPRVDVWALGAVLHELVTLRPPFEAPTRSALFHKVLHEPALDLARVRPGVPRDLAVVAATALAKDPRERYADAAALAEDLEAVVASRPIAARRPSAAARLVRWARREPGLAAALSLLVLAVAAAGALGGYLAAKAPALEVGSAELARQEREDAITALVSGRVRGEEAQERFRRALAVQPGWSLGRALLAVQLVREQRLDEARAALAAAPAEVDSPGVERLAAELVRAAEAGEQPAVPAADGIADGDEAYLAALVTLEGDPGEEQHRRALELARRSIYLAPRPAERSFHLLVRSANALGELEDLARGEQVLLARFPDSALAWFHVGMARSRDPKGAAEANARCLELDPGFAQAWILLSALRTMTGEFEAGAEAFEQGLALTRPGTDEHRRLLAFRAGLLERMQRPEEAEVQWGRLLESTPDDVAALVARGALLVDLERFEEGEALLEQALELDPDNARARELLGL